MIAKLNELGFDVGCKIYDGCLVRRKQHSKLPQRVITACEEHIEGDRPQTALEKCLLAERRAACYVPMLRSRAWTAAKRSRGACVTVNENVCILMR